MRFEPSVLVLLTISQIGICFSGDGFNNIGVNIKEVASQDFANADPKFIEAWDALYNRVIPSVIAPDEDNVASVSRPESKLTQLGGGSNDKDKTNLMPGMGAGDIKCSSKYTSKDDRYPVVFPDFDATIATGPHQRLVRLIITNGTPYKMSSRPLPVSNRDDNKIHWPDIPSGDSAIIEFIYELSDVVGNNNGRRKPEMHSGLFTRPDMAPEGADAIYVLEGTTRKIKFLSLVDAKAESTDSYTLNVIFDISSSNGYESADMVELIKSRNGNYQWVLTGNEKEGYFNSENSVAWMQAALPILGVRKLNELCFPGSHHAGMNHLSNVQQDRQNGAAANINTQTQTVSIYEQLVRGSRWLDFQPCTVLKGSDADEPEYYLCNFRRVSKETVVGATGQTIEQTIKDINRFMTNYPGELLMIDINPNSGFLFNTTTTNGLNLVSKMEENEDWLPLMNMLNEGIKKPCPFPQGYPLSDRPLGELISDGKGCVAMLAQDIKPASNQFHFGIHFNAISRSSEADSVRDMRNDQLRYLDMHPKSILQLSWVVETSNQSRRDRAADAVSDLLSHAYHRFSPKSYPNVILTDYFGDTADVKDSDQALGHTDRHLVALCLSINRLFAAEACSPRNGNLNHSEDPNSKLKIHLQGLQKIMFVGDSITHGFQGDYTWRYRLWQWLRNEAPEFEFDFVGPYNGTLPPMEPYAPKPPTFNNQPPKLAPFKTTGQYAREVHPEFDHDHFAVWGRAIAEDRDLIFSQILKYQPDIIFVLMGFNDLAWFYGDDTATLMNMKALVDFARMAKPNLKILIGNIPQRLRVLGREDLIDKTARYNLALKAYAPFWSLPTSPVLAVDLSNNYDCGLETCAAGYDGLHPNSYGEYQIASVFSKALHTYFGIGNAPLSIPDSFPERNVYVPDNIDASGSSTGVRVTWDEVFGARGYDLRQRRAGTTKWITQSIPSNRWDTTFTTEGVDWEYQVRSSAGDAVKSSWSMIYTATSTRNTVRSPRNIVVTPWGDGFDIRWDPVTDSRLKIDGYEVVIWDKTMMSPFVQSRGTKTTQISFRGLTYWHQYDIWVVCWAANGGSIPRAGNSVVIGAGQFAK